MNRKKQYLFIQVLLCLFFCNKYINAQNTIVKIEYSVDSLAGYGQGTSIPLTTANDVTANFNLPLSSLTGGFHTLYLRAEDENGNWSIVQNQAFYNLQINSSNNINKQITYLEYFVDTPTQYGSGTSIPITQGDSINTSFNLPLTNLNGGFHTLYLRAEDVNGNWSIVQNQAFYNLQINSSNSLNKQITYLEYFVDNPTQYGNGISIPITVASGDSINTTFNLPLDNLSGGFHTLYLRAEDVNGNWSIVQNQAFYNIQINWANNINKQISYLEYFVDTDPGFGNGNSISTVPNDTINTIFNLPITNLSAGSHTLYIRAEDVNGNWSIVQYNTFYRLQLSAMLQAYYNSDSQTMNQTQDIDSVGDNFNKWSGSVVDTISVLIRSAIAPDYAVLAEIHGLSLNIDGTLSESLLPSLNTVNRYVYLVINHRSSIETWSDIIDLSDTVSSNYNFFTNPPSTQFPNNMTNTDEYGNVIEGNLIWAGDVTDGNDDIGVQDGYVTLDDVFMIYYANLVIMSGYNILDINGDGYVTLDDVFLAYNNNLVIAQTVNPITLNSKKK